MTTIAAVASALPPYYYTQDELIAALKEIWAARPASLERLENYHRHMAVEGRYLALPLESYGRKAGFGARNDAWIRSALELAEGLVSRLLAAAGLPAEEVGLFAFTTITGLAVPSLEARLMNCMPFSRHLKRLPLFGLGCMGGAAGVARVADYLRGSPGEAAILLSVELCSLTIQRDDLSAANLVSSGLFGDGAAAALLVGAGHPLARPGLPCVVDSLSVFFPDTEYIMGWDVVDTGFKIVLSSDVAEVAHEQLAPQVVEFLACRGLTPADIAHWVVHPGGPKVMQAIETGLGLEAGALNLSRQNLAQVGNVSSAAVLMILEQTLAERSPAAGDYGLMMAMGPAFSAELVLLRW